MCSFGIYALSRRDIVYYSLRTSERIESGGQKHHWHVYVHIRPAISGRDRHQEYAACQTTLHVSIARQVASGVALQVGSVDKVPSEQVGVTCH